MTAVEIADDLALAHKRIDGRIARLDGGTLQLGWRSVFTHRAGRGSLG